MGKSKQSCPNELIPQPEINNTFSCALTQTTRMALVDLLVSLGSRQWSPKKGPVKNDDQGC